MIRWKNIVWFLMLAASVDPAGGKEETPSQPRPGEPTTVTYLFSEPDGGDFALLPNHDDKAGKAGHWNSLRAR